VVSRDRSNAIIFHGSGGHPDACWYRWLGARLEERGYRVEIPHYPGLNREPIASLLAEVLARHRFDERTVLIGHSGGAALLLALVEHLEDRVAQTILVAGYCTPPNTNAEPVLQERYDWAAIRAKAGELYFVNSLRDPYGCDAGQGRAMLERLGGTQVVRDEGHFGDVDDPYPTFPLLERLVAPAAP
jgi:predicted alpha/beta hydrolase family esterase